MDTSDLAAIGLLLTGIGLLINSYQIWQTKQVALGQFLLQFDEMFIAHAAVHHSLRPDGKWAHNIDPEDMKEVEAYVGLLERLGVLVDKGVIDKDIARDLYGYRVRNVVRNPSIHSTLLAEEAGDWKNFINLCRIFGYEKDLTDQARDLLSQETTRNGNH